MRLTGALHEKVHLGAVSDKQFQTLCRVIDRMDLAEDEALATNAQRVALRPELLKWLGDTLRHHKLADLSPKRTFVAAAAAAATLCGVSAHAQNAPTRVILPVRAGSGVDTIVRAAQGALSKALGGQPVVIENLPGAGGITGTSAIVKASPDGNTIGVVSNNHAVNPSVFKNLPYDSIDDITTISVVGQTPFVLFVNPRKIPASNAKELQAFLKAKPDAYNYASSGNGTIIHLHVRTWSAILDTPRGSIPRGTVLALWSTPALRQWRPLPCPAARSSS